MTGDGARSRETSSSGSRSDPSGTAKRWAPQDLVTADYDANALHILLGNSTTTTVITFTTTTSTTVTADCLQPIMGVSLATQDDTG